MLIYQDLHTPSATYTFRLYHRHQLQKNRRYLHIPYYTAEHKRPNTFYHLLYLGITNDFYARLQAHHKIQQAITLGMTHIGILRKSSGRTRKSIEKNLLQNLNPPLNQTWLHDIHSKIRNLNSKI